MNHTQIEINITEMKTSLHLLKNFFTNFICNVPVANTGLENYINLTKTCTKRSVTENSFTIWRSSAVNDCQS